MILRGLILLIYSVISEIIALISIGSGEKYGIKGESIFSIYIATAWMIIGVYILLTFFRFIKLEQLVVSKDILSILKFSIVYMAIWSVMIIIRGVGLESLDILIFGGLLLIPIHSIYFYIMNIEISIENLLVGLYGVPVSMYTLGAMLMVIVGR